MGATCEPCCTTAKGTGDDQRLRANRNIDCMPPPMHKKMVSIDRMPTVEESQNLMLRRNISGLKIELNDSDVYPTMAKDTPHLLLANPFGSNFNAISDDDDDDNGSPLAMKMNAKLSIGLIVLIEIYKVTKDGLQCKLPSYLGISGHVSRDNISYEINDKIKSYGKDADIKYIIRDQLKGATNLKAKVLTFDEDESMATLSCINLNSKINLF